MWIQIANGYINGLGIMIIGEETATCFIRPRERETSNLFFNTGKIAIVYDKTFATSLNWFGLF